MIFFTLLPSFSTLFLHLPPTNPLPSAFSGPFTDITHVLSEWGSIILITGDNTIHQLEERDTASKLEMLFKKNLYVMAISLAYSSNYDEASITEIYRKYGDHLYGKGDFDSAMTQYLHTIGRLEPSYVIRKVHWIYFWSFYGLFLVLFGLFFGFCHLFWPFLAFLWPFFGLFLAFFWPFDFSVL